MTKRADFARLVTEKSLRSGGHELVVSTGGGPGVMEAGNRGAADAGGRSIGLNIVLPHEQAPNAYVTPELCFNFHYFAIRKMHFLMRARAICVFPGGFGTMDETVRVADPDPDRPDGADSLPAVRPRILGNGSSTGTRWQMPARSPRRIWSSSDSWRPREEAIDWIDNWAHAENDEARNEIPGR